jgi:hypothetical protein
LRTLTGVTPSRLRSVGHHPIAAAFRHATGGGTVYV